MAERDPEPAPDTLRLLNAEVSARAGRLDANTARLDTKATTLLGFILAACTFLATQPIGGWWKVPAYAVFVVASVLGFQSMRPRKFKDAPEPDAVLKFLAERPESVALTLILAAKVQAFTENQATHEKKATNWRRCLVAFSFAVVLLIGSLVLGGQHRLEAAPSGAASSSTSVKRDLPAGGGAATVVPATPTQLGGHDGGRSGQHSGGVPSGRAPG